MPFIEGVSNILLRTKLVPGACFVEVAIEKSVARDRDKRALLSKVIHLTESDPSSVPEGLLTGDLC